MAWCGTAVPPETGGYASCVFKHLVWPGMEGGVSGHFFFGYGLLINIDTSLRTVDGTRHFVVETEIHVDPTHIYPLGATSVALPDSGTVVASLPMRVQMGPATGSMLFSKYEQTPMTIDKSGVTHSKECRLSEKVVYTAEYVATVGEVSSPPITRMTYGWVILSSLTSPHYWGVPSGGALGHKYIYEFADITLNGVAINTTRYTPRHDTTTFGTPQPSIWAEGFDGSSIGVWADEPMYVAPHQSAYWEGIIEAPYSYDFSQYQFRQMDDEPLPGTLRVWCSGLIAKDEHGNLGGTWNGTIDELRSLGRVTQSGGCYSWDRAYTDVVPGVSMWLDEESAKAHGIELINPDAETPPSVSGPSFDHDATCIFDCWPLSAVNRTDPPYMTDVVTLKPDTGGGIYGTHNAHKHTDWVGSNASSPDASGDFEVYAGGGSIKLNLKSNYITRQGLVPSQEHLPVPLAYHRRRHDSCYGEGDPPEAAEARYDWRGYYLKIPLKVPQTPLTATVEIKYYDDLSGPIDNHLTGKVRQEEYEYSPGSLHTLTREIEIIDPVAGGWADILVDTFNEQAPAAVCALVQSIEITLPEGEYRLKEPELPATDPGDKQEYARRDRKTTKRPAPESDGYRLKIDEHYQYRQGVVSATVNGFHDRALYLPDNQKPCTIEKCFDTLNVLTGEHSGLDLTHCYDLASWPVHNSCERWTYSHNAGAEAAHLTDADSNRLCTLNVYDIAPQMSFDDESGALPCAVRVARITCAPGIPYTFFGTKYTHGRAHGLLLWDDYPADFPRARGCGTVYLYHRLPTDDQWNFFKTCGGSDQHGRWASPAAPPYSPAGELYSYASREKSNETMVGHGRFATREWASGLLGTAVVSHELFPQGQPFAERDPAGTHIWLIAASPDDDGCRLWQIDGSYDIPLEVVTLPDEMQTGHWVAPSVAAREDGTLAVCGTYEGAMRLFTSRDWGHSWEEQL